ncbi:ribulokinase [Clostridium estertheticum]|uniref:ribulokinase n=1 Tax=Clostridium estertheticum TaxID=238834 RepID=UPI001C0B718F|nr:ribulokinase [Clostridium estertheticum]MBU3072121.1 ribulokinase [Clostridium estertheticum]MBU3162213.1 ribulokinase [Clostridium estertheticum]
MTTKYTVGVDYGTLSSRAVVVNLDNGKVVSSAVKNYPSAVIDEILPGTTIKLGNNWALQDPNDYYECFIATVKEAVSEATKTISKDDIIGVAIDFTACTVLPVKNDGTPLMNIKEWHDNPHAWVKLWKHHAAQDQADRLNAIAKKRNEPWLKYYGGKISSEWLFPKLMQIVEEAPDVYAAMDDFIEATDWLTWQLTGKKMKNATTAGYKAIWNAETGFPSNEFFKELNPLMENVIEDKIGTKFYPVGTKAGGLLEKIAKATGLNIGIAVGVGNVDAHVSVAPTGVIGPRTMLNIMGTSTCDITLGEKEIPVPGMCGVVKDGAVPGFYAYESGQNAVGDIFGWFVNNQVPERYFKEAEKNGLNIHQLLEAKAKKLKIGESGLIALDWWNGNRSILVDTDLTGLVLGMNMDTKPEEIYRALIEATAFGKRLIIDTFEENGVPIDTLTVCGGLPHRNQMLNQIYADVTNKEMFISEHHQAPAIGAAMFAAVAAGKEAFGYDTIQEASKQMARLKENSIKPIPENVKRYEAIYKEYVKLHDYFGRGANDVMKHLKKIKESVSKEG